MVQIQKDDFFGIGVHYLLLSMILLGFLQNFSIVKSQSYALGKRFRGRDTAGGVD